MSFPAEAQPAPTPAELEKLTTAIAAVRARIAEDEAERSAVEIQLREAERSLAELAANITAAEARIAMEEAELARLRERSGELETLKERQQALVAQYIRAAYISGRREYLRLLLNQEDLDAASRTLRYYRYFAEARAARIAAYEGTLAELDDLRAGIEESSRRLREERGQLALRQGELEAGQARRRALLDELDRSLAESGGELERLQRERAEMELLIEELRRSITELALGGDEQPFAAMKGSLPWPGEGPLLHRFGDRHELGDLSRQGITIAAAAGAEVRAVHHGRVVFADWFEGSGLLLIIDHGDGYMSLYAHNQSLYREVGDWVSSGEAIAAAGNTGGRRESGVYFEIRHEGRPEDPVPWLRPRN